MISCHHFKVNPLWGLCGREVSHPGIVSMVVNLIFAEVPHKAPIGIVEEMKACVHNHAFYTHTCIHTQKLKRKRELSVSDQLNT